MEVETYTYRSKNVQLLGFKNYTAYLRSPLWDCIRREVLYRDACTCRSNRCKRKCKTLQAHHLGYSYPVLLGVNPSLIVTLCRECHEQCEYEGNVKLDLERVLRKSLSVVAGIQVKKGVDNRVGRWYRNQWLCNQETAQRILWKYTLGLPQWYNVVLADVREGRLSEKFVSYLGLDLRRQRKKL